MKNLLNITIKPNFYDCDTYIIVKKYNKSYDVESLEGLFERRVNISNLFNPKENKLNPSVMFLNVWINEDDLEDMKKLIIIYFESQKNKIDDIIKDLKK